MQQRTQMHTFCCPLQLRPERIAPLVASETMRTVVITEICRRLSDPMAHAMSHPSDLHPAKYLHNSCC